MLDAASTFSNVTRHIHLETPVRMPLKIVIGAFDLRERDISSILAFDYYGIINLVDDQEKQSVKTG